MPKLSKREWIGVVAALVVITYLMFGQSLALPLKQSISKDATSADANTAAVANSGASNINSNTNMSNTGGVQVQEVTLGSGATIATGMSVGVHYVLKLADGTLIQDSKVVNNGAPFEFTYGAGQLIPGWEMGINGMKVGGKRILVIPPELGYGAQAVGPIPANSTLVFEIEVVSAK